MTEGDSVISKLIQGSFSLLQQRLEGMTIQLKLFQYQWNEAFGNGNKTTEKNTQVNNALQDYKNLSKELNIAIENRDKELKKLNQLEKIEEKVGKGLKGGMFPIEDFAFDKPLSSSLNFKRVCQR